MKKLKKIIILLLLAVSLKAELITLNLVEFANMASNQNNITILINEELKDKNFAFAVNTYEDYSLSAFVKALGSLDLQLAKADSFYYVEPRKIYKEVAKYRAIKLNFVKYSDIANFLEVYEKDIRFEFIKTSKTLLIYSNEKEYKSIYNLINSIDVLPKQLKLRITIVNTDLGKLKELGSDSSALNLTNNTNFFFNLISYPFTVKNTVSDSDSKGFYSFLKLMDKKEISNFISNPTLTLSDEKETVFNVVDTVPFLNGTTTIDDTDTKTTSSYEYKDVGTQISITPHIYKDNNVYLDLELNVSNVLSDTNNLNTTSKKYIKQSFHMPVNKVLVLTGLNKKDSINSIEKVPLLSDIPFLGWLFKYESNEVNESNLSIVFELVEND